MPDYEINSHAHYLIQDISSFTNPCTMCIVPPSHYEFSVNYDAVYANIAFVY